jgi:hypothetical protein
MYKDITKQKQANKEANKRYRLNKAKNNAPRLTELSKVESAIPMIPSVIPVIPVIPEQAETVIPDTIIPPVEPVEPLKGITTPEGIAVVFPDNYSLIDCTCKHCQQNRATGARLSINHGDYKPAEELESGEVNRVSMPGDVDYDGVCTTEWITSKTG